MCHRYENQQRYFEQYWGDCWACSRGIINLITNVIDTHTSIIIIVFASIEMAGSRQSVIVKAINLIYSLPQHHYYADGHKSTTLDQLEQKTHWHITFLRHQLTIRRTLFSTVQSETGTVFLMKLFIHRSLSISGITFYHKLRLRYFTDFGERESRPFHEEPETLLYFNQHFMHRDIL